MIVTAVGDLWLSSTTVLHNMSLTQTIKIHADHYKESIENSQKHITKKKQVAYGPWLLYHRSSNRGKPFDTMPQRFETYNNVAFNSHVDLLIQPNLNSGSLKT